MPIYILVLNKYNRFENIGVFSSKEKAKEYAKKEREYYGSEIGFFIEEYELDNTDNYAIIDLDI